MDLKKRLEAKEAKLENAIKRKQGFRLTDSCVRCSRLVVIIDDMKFETLRCKASGISIKWQEADVMVCDFFKRNDRKTFNKMTLEKFKRTKRLINIEEVY